MSTLKARIRASMEAFACGDAVGMPTEFMTLQDIREKFGIVDRLLESEESQNHSELPKGSVTDDTEQNLYLLRAYQKSGSVTVENTTEALLHWIRETDAVAKKYIGPSSKRALEAVEGGADPHETGIMGTTCGGIMRSPSVVWFDPEADAQTLKRRIVDCLMPTHYTSEALEAAGAYAFALQAALLGKTREEILLAAEWGAEACMAEAPWTGCAASAICRIRTVQAMLGTTLKTDEEILKFLFSFCGTGLPSADVCAAAFVIWLAADGSAWRAVRLGASVGGDTDTIAALGAALTAAESGAQDIPSEVLAHVVRQNGLHFSQLLGE